MQNVLKNQINVFLKDLDHSVSGDMHIKNDKKILCGVRLLYGGGQIFADKFDFKFFP